MIRKQKKKINDPSMAKRYRRKLYIRKKVSGTAERPRIVVCKSNKNLSVQVVDDTASETLAAVQTYGKNGVDAKATKEGAVAVGKALSAKMKEKNIETGVFDRAGHKFHGVIKSLVDTLKEEGIRV